MAEVLGAVAAVVQFVDVALRLSSCLERFCSDVRNVPRRFVQLQTDLRQQIEIAQQIQNHRLPGFATTVSASTFNTPLVEYIGLAEELCKTLEALLARKNDGVFQRGWDAICSVRKKEEVASICDRLEQKKSTLSLWLEAANLKLASSIAATADQTRLDVRDTLTLVKAVDNTSNNIATNTAHLLPHIERVDRTLATTSIRTEHILENSQRLLAGYDTDATARETSRQITAMTLANTEQIIAAIEMLTLGPGKSSPHAQSGYVTDHVYAGSSASQQFQQGTKNHGRRQTKCKCRTVGTARRWQPLSVLRFTRTFRTQHFSHCPEYRNSEQSLEVTMQIVPPSWLLYHTIDFGTKIRNWSTMSPFSISPIVIGTSRLVDSKTSPAFRAIANTGKELKDRPWVTRPWVTRLHHPEVPRLQVTLQRLFDNGEASVLDTDSDGRTLLSEVVRLFILEAHLYGTYNDYTAIVQCLLDGGADPNTLNNTSPGVGFAYLRDHVGTMCDRLVNPIAEELKCSTPERSRLFINVVDQLVQSGGHTSKPYLGVMGRGLQCTEFRNYVKQLAIFEDQIDLIDLGHILPVILGQQTEHFRRMIDTANSSILNRKSPVNGLAPIHFAVLWPTGLRMLVETGVDVNTEDNYGRRPIHLAVALGIVDSVRCLLNADCGLFTPANDCSLLQYALMLHEEDEKSQILSQLIQALCDRHNRLKDIAILYLPPSVSTKLELTLGELQERRAPSIMETLLSYGVDIPPALELDGKRLYVFCMDRSRRIQLTAKAANQLWCSGFRLFDEPNDNGWTPFLLSWFCHNFDMIDWFANRGVGLDSRHTDVRLTALHLFAKGMLATETASSDTSTMKRHYIELLHEKLGIPYDDCSCMCSPDGCTPAKFVFDGADDWRDPSQKDQVRDFIADMDPPKPLLDQYIYQFTRHVLFDFLGGGHTCCSLGRRHYSLWDLQRPTWKNGWPKCYYGPSGFGGQHSQCCKNGLPVPRQWTSSYQALYDPHIFSVTLESAMSHYDEMDRPDTMPAEEQVFAYIRWILEEGYLDIEVIDGCEHRHED